MPPTGPWVAGQVPKGSVVIHSEVAPAESNLMFELIDRHLELVVRGPQIHGTRSQRCDSKLPPRRCTS